MRSLLLGLCAGVLMLGGCAGSKSGTDGSTNAPAKKTELAMKHVTGEWTLTSLAGHDLKGVEEQRRPRLTIREDGQLAGFSGVNRIAGKPDWTGITTGAFRAGNLVATKMAGPPEAMKLETAFLDALSRADRIAIEDGSLVLSQGSTRLATMARSK